MGKIDLKSNMTDYKRLWTLNRLKYGGLMSLLGKFTFILFCIRYNKVKPKASKCRQTIAEQSDVIEDDVIDFNNVSWWSI